MTSTTRNVLSYGEIFSRVKTGDIVFTFKYSLFGLNKIQQLGIVIKKHGANMILINTKRGFTIKPLKSFHSFLWFPVKSSWTPRAEVIINSLISHSGSSLSNTWKFWFKQADCNFKLLKIIRNLFISLFNGFPDTLELTTKNLAAYAENNSSQYFIIYTGIILYQKSGNNE